MSSHVTYYLGLNSPWAYLGSQRFAEILQNSRASVAVRPIDLGQVFPKTGGLPLAKRAPERQAYRLVELQRWREARNLPLNLHPAYFPAPEGTAARMVIAADRSGGQPLALAHAILRAVWVEERNIAEVGTLLAIAEETGHHGDSLLAKASDPETARIYEGYTAEALAAGVFGVPTYVVDGELFWGQDRLDFVEARLRADRA